MASANAACLNQLFDFFLGNNGKVQVDWLSLKYSPSEFGLTVDIIEIVVVSLRVQTSPEAVVRRVLHLRITNLIIHITIEDKEARSALHRSHPRLST